MSLSDPITLTYTALDGRGIDMRLVPANGSAAIPVQSLQIILEPLAGGQITGTLCPYREEQLPGGACTIELRRSIPWVEPHQEGLQLVMRLPGVAVHLCADKETWAFNGCVIDLWHPEKRAL